MAVRGRVDPVRGDVALLRLFHWDRGAVTTVEAYEPPPPNDWVRPVVVGWALFMGAFGAWGWIAERGFKDDGFISAAVSIAACLLLLNASVQMRRAGAKKARRATTIWAMALILFGSWSGYSAHHAFEMAQGEPVQLTSLMSLEALQSGFLLIFFLGSAWIDPLLMWAVEETERAEPKAVENQSGSQAHDEPKPKGSRAHLRSIAGGLTGSVALAVAPGSQAHEPSSFPTEPVQQTSLRMSPAQVRNMDDPSRATARLMLRQGQGPAQVHKATGVPLSTLKRWAKEAA